MNATTYATLPTGQHVELSNPPVYRVGDHAWLTAEQARFQAQGLLVLVSTHQVVAVQGTGPNEGCMGFVLVAPNGQPTDRAVFVVYPDGHAESSLPLPSDYEAWLHQHEDDLTAVEEGRMSEAELVEKLSHEHEPKAEADNGSDTGFYL